MKVKESTSFWIPFFQAEEQTWRKRKKDIKS